MPPLNTFSRSAITVAISQALLINSMQAATITVNNNGDDDMGCTLREAVESMVAGNVGSTGCTNSSIDAFGTNNTIDFSVTGTLNLTQAEELSVVNIPLEIKGPGQDNLTISGNNNARVFNIADADVTIDGVTISSGSVNRSGGGINADFFSKVSIENSSVSGNIARNGGGIAAVNGGIVNLKNSTVSGNSASSNGGGIYIDEYSDNSSVTVYNSTVTLVNSTVSGNSASGDGGGIAVDNSTISLTNSKVSDNLATAGDGGGISATNGSNVAITNSNVTVNLASNGSGGGIFADQGAIVTLVGATVSGNSALRYGGGLFVGSQNTSATLTNSTISGNSVSVYGGGIYSRGNNPVVTNTLSLINSTVSNNSAARLGGGVMFTNASNVSLTNSLISGNRAAYQADEIFESDSTITLSGNNLFGDNGSTNSEAFTGFTPGLNDITATNDGSAPTSLDQILLPLADNGGDTQTHALGPESPARDVGALANCPMNDQRGQLRDDGDDACDIGAMEFNSDDIPEENGDGFIVIPLKNGKAVVVPN